MTRPAANEMELEFKLTSPDPVKDVVGTRRNYLKQKFDLESAQGILPFTNEKYYEQSNPILRSGLFSANKLGGEFREWTEVFVFGTGTIQYKGPALTVDHEHVLARLLLLARGKSLTKPVNVQKSKILEWLELSDAGENRKRVQRLLDDLEEGQIRISCKSALSRLYFLLTSPMTGDLPDGKFFRQYIDNLYGPQLKMIAAALEADEEVQITMQFIKSQTVNNHTGRMLINLDPVTAVFFDGVNTTLLPFEIYSKLDRFGKKILPFIASHRDGVYPIKLENYFIYIGSISVYEKVKRRFKSDFKKNLIHYEAEGWIEKGWELYRNDKNEEMVSGLKLHPSLRVRSALDLPVIDVSE
ncbi:MULTISPECIES: plasmid replication initiator TrfA [Pseudomonas]|uniref:Uncharacterized protein n=2 Tax=Pseudomonas TaxID=286 RepID=A0A2X2E9Z1_PSELU|nr:MULTISPECIES: plasmid replication initiator TrfA [Pseudomonas]MCG7374361.1 TrfA [Pseudomonas luteola]SER22704.1 TrfA protein [Pseudomonas lutea]SPZ04969.1 Uncharacterised protein [Pseudomonas luteola]